MFKERIAAPVCDAIGGAVARADAATMPELRVLRATADRAQMGDNGAGALRRLRADVPAAD